MDTIAKFEKVTYDQFKKDVIDCLPRFREISMNDEQIENEIHLAYDAIRLPRRATSGSAGYDFFSPCHFFINPGGSMIIPTGIRAMIDPGWFLNMLPRSGGGFKYGVRLANTCGIIDSDYYGNVKNQGHIMIKLCRDDIISSVTYDVEEGEAFCQGIFIPYGITIDDTAAEIRTGGFGSTDNK